MKKNRTKQKPNIGGMVSTGKVCWIPLNMEQADHVNKAREILTSSWVDDIHKCLTAGRFDTPPHDLEGK